MSEIELKSGYYNANLVETTNENGETTYEPDRSYNAEDLNDFLEGLVSPNGIYYNIATKCQVIEGDGGLNVIVREGKGIVNSHWFKIDADTKLEFSAADVVLSRKDRVIVRYSKDERNCVLTIKKGTPASNPVAPTLTQDVNGIYEISLATVTIEKNAKVITTTNIKDERADSSVCGWITGLVQQLDTSEVFKQYETAFEEKSNEVDHWFESVQETVKATSLYREYEYLYKTTTTNIKELLIPTSINYVHNGLDVLNVILYGTTHLVEDVDYTISTDGTSITLSEAIADSGTKVLFINKKCIDGQAAEDLTLQVETLQEQVNGLTLNNNFSYHATGTDDNIAISNIVKNFLDGTGDYSSVKDNASMSLYIHGEIEITNLIDDQMAFDFHNTVESKRKVFVDFGNATITYSGEQYPDTLVIFGSNNGNVVISKANVYLNSTIYPTWTYIFHGGIIRDCTINNGIKTNWVYAVYNAKEVSNCNITTYGHGIYECETIQNNNITITDYALRDSGGVTTQVGGEGVNLYSTKYAVFIGNKIYELWPSTIDSSTYSFGNYQKMSD